HFPAIDVLASVSRLTDDLLSAEEYRAAGGLRDHLATYQAAHDLVAVGAYVAGSDRKIDRALAALDAVNDYLRQSRHERSSRDESLRRLQGLFPAAGPATTDATARLADAAARG